VIARLVLAAVVLAVAQTPDGGLRADLDRLFNDPLLRRALLAARVESLATGRLLYDRNADMLVMPASNMKILTVATAAQKLGWDYRYETRLEAAGPVSNGILKGDLIVTGTGDPSIGSPDDGHALLFLEWANALARAGIRRVDGRLIGDDNAFDDDGLGAGWAWDYLGAGYAAPVGGLNYNENAAAVRITAGTARGMPATATIGPPGHALDLVTDITTDTPDTTASLDVLRAPASARLTVRGRVPLKKDTVLRTAAIDNPTRFFVNGLELALASRGITIGGGACDIDDLPAVPPAAGRRVIATHQSEPLSSLAGYAMKVSQNFYAEALLKTLGRTSSRPGTTEGGRQAVRETLTSWGVPADAVVQYDGSGLSRYNYVTASTLVTVLRHIWEDERLRGRFVAELPVAGKDGTLELRMRNTVLDGNVQAKTGTISNVRALSGFLQTASGEKLVFSIIANHYTAPTAQVDAIVEKALERLVK